MLKKVNFHTHTALCRHAEGMEADYVLAAKQAGLQTLGFSDHGPYPDNRFNVRMQYGELDGHLQRVRELQARFLMEMDILAGLEIEYCYDMDSYYESLFQQRHLDYLLLGQHGFYSSSGAFINSFDMPSDTTLLLDYAKTVCDGMRTGFFSILAHPDLPFLNDLVWDENCREACRRILYTAGETGVLLELNANGIRRGQKAYSDGLRYPYPYPPFWQEAARAGLPVLVGSDCHSPSLIWDGAMEEAFRLAGEWGLHLTDRLEHWYTPSR